MADAVPRFARFHVEDWPLGRFALGLSGIVEPFPARASERVEIPGDADADTQLAVWADYEHGASTTDDGQLLQWLPTQHEVSVIVFELLQDQDAGSRAQYFSRELG